MGSSWTLPMATTASVMSCRESHWGVIIYRLYFVQPNKVAIGSEQRGGKMLLHCCFVGMLFMTLLFSGYRCLQRRMTG